MIARVDEEIARGCIDTLARSDYDAWLALHHADCEFTPLTARAEGGEPYRGHAGCRDFWADVHAAFEDWHPRVEEVRDLGDALLLTIQFEGRGRTSGVPIDRRVWQVFRARDGQAIWWKIYPSEADALAAISTREWAPGG
jgi:ketosteroid isomerase-like protein